VPELPEVETARRGIAPHLIGRRVTGVILRRPDLRWPIPPEISELLPGQRIDSVERRAKYLLLNTEAGSALLHLGMTGVLRVLPPDALVGKHDHVDIAVEPTATEGPRVLRFTDARRFGSLLRPMNYSHRLAPNHSPMTLTVTCCGNVPEDARRR
jgi:formamidopyrimidine-DNA glycosylase